MLRRQNALEVCADDDEPVAKCKPVNEEYEMDLMRRYAPEAGRLWYQTGDRSSTSTRWSWCSESQNTAAQARDQAWCIDVPSLTLSSPPRTPETPTVPAAVSPHRPPPATPPRTESQCLRTFGMAIQFALNMRDKQQRKLRW